MRCKNCGLEKKLHVRGFICATPKEGALGTVFQPEDEKKAIIKEFEGEDRISLESLR